MLVGLLVACYVVCASPVYAEPRELPPGTVVQLPRNGERFELSQIRWLVSRSQLDKSNAAAEMEQRLERDLLSCSGRLAEARRPEPGWRIAARWAAWGVTVSAAFFAGMWVAK